MINEKCVLYTKRNKNKRLLCRPADAMHRDDQTTPEIGNVAYSLTEEATSKACGNKQQNRRDCCKKPAAARWRIEKDESNNKPLGPCSTTMYKLCAWQSQKKPEMHVVGRSRPFWNVRVMRVSRSLRGPRPTPRCRSSTWLSHGFHHVCDAFRGSRPLDAQRAYDASMHHYVRRSSLPRTVHNGLSACARCGSCLRAG